MSAHSRALGPVHLNLAHSSAQMTRLDPEAAVREDADLVLCSGRHEHPAIANAAFRTDEQAEAGESVERAREFFAERGRGFSLWVRGEQPEDEDLVAAAGAAGLEQVFEMPEMVCVGRVADPVVPDGFELERVRSDDQARDYWELTADAYLSLGFPAELFAQYDDREGMWAANLAAFLAYREGQALSAALTIVTDGVAGIFWVGTREEGRGSGLGRATTAAATNAGFDLGAEIASLQASPMGEPLYRDMGYETLFPYRLLMAQPP